MYLVFISFAICHTELFCKITFYFCYFIGKWTSVSCPKTLQHAYGRGRGLNPWSSDQWITALPAEPRLLFCSLVLLGSNLVQRLYCWIMWCSLDPYSGISFSVALPQREFRYPPLFCASGAVMVQCWNTLKHWSRVEDCLWAYPHVYTGSSAKLNVHSLHVQYSLYAWWSELASWCIKIFSSLIFKCRCLLVVIQKVSWVTLFSLLCSCPISINCLMKHSWK